MNDDASGVGHYYAQRSPQDGRLCVSKRTTRTRNAAWQLLRNLLMAFCDFVWNVDAKKMDCVKKKNVTAIFGMSISALVDQVNTECGMQWMISM